MTGTPFDKLRVTGFNGAYSLITYARLNKTPGKKRERATRSICRVARDVRIRV